MADSAHLKIGIIGFGPFAQFLSQTMIKQGHAVVATSRSDHSLICSQLGISFYKEFDDFFASGSEVILLCTSILSTADVLSSIPPANLHKPSLFVDVLSVKEYPRDLLLRTLPEKVDVLCTHPMFGPESGRSGWQGLPLVYDRVRVRDHGLCDKFLAIFQTEGCSMVEMSCEEHDRMAAKTQFLTHTIGRCFICSLVLMTILILGVYPCSTPDMGQLKPDHTSIDWCRILGHLEIQPTPIDTRGFQTLVAVKDSSIKDSIDLYFGIFQHNKFSKNEMEKLGLAFQTVKGMLEQRTDRFSCD